MPRERPVLGHRRVRHVVRRTEASAWARAQFCRPAGYGFLTGPPAASIIVCVKGYIVPLYADERGGQDWRRARWKVGSTSCRLAAGTRFTARRRRKAGCRRSRSRRPSRDWRGRVVKLKDYFYAIVPLEYLSAAAPPPSWFIDDLMRAMELPYYVGLLSAAGLHGASHQQPQEFQVVTDRSVRPIAAGRSRIRYFVSKYIATAATQGMKTPTGSMRVSTPEVTILDLVRFVKAAGHLDNIATVIAELLPSVEASRLLKAVKVRNDLPSAQRLGYVLDRLRAKKLAGPLHEWIGRRELRAIPLHPGRVDRGAREDPRWHVLVSAPIEVEV